MLKPKTLLHTSQNPIKTLKKLQKHITKTRVFQIIGMFFFSFFARVNSLVVVVRHCHRPLNQTHPARSCHGTTTFECYIGSDTALVPGHNIVF